MWKLSKLHFLQNVNCLLHNNRLYSVFSAFAGVRSKCHNTLLSSSKPNYYLRFSNWVELFFSAPQQRVEKLTSHLIMQESVLLLFFYSKYNEDLKTVKIILKLLYTPPPPQVSTPPPPAPPPVSTPLGTLKKSY